MKTSSLVSRSVLGLSLGLVGLTASHASAQTSISTAPYTINASGHYILTGNLNNSNAGIPSITIAAPNVIVDLNGYYVAGPGNSAASTPNDSVIYVGNVANVTVKNGTVAGGAYGIYYTANNSTTTSRNYVVDTVTVTRCYLAGLYWATNSAPGSLVKNCSFSTIGNSTASTNVSPSAIYTHGSIRMDNNNIGDVTATGNGSSYGINGASGDFAIGNTIANCSNGIILVSKFLNNLTYNVTTPFPATGNATGNN